MSPRLKLRAAATPLVMAGALWASSAFSAGPIGGGAQTPPPCGPDGVCLPRPQTYGWYQTRWRTFPGDGAGVPTPAEAGAPTPEETLGGPQLPTATQESQVGPAPKPRDPNAAGAEGEAPAEDAAGAGLGTLPGESPLPGFNLPGAGPEPAETAPPAGDTQGPQPGAEPAGDPLDPFGGAPQPPTWLRNAALGQGQRANPSLNQMPVVEHATAIVETPQAATPAGAEAPVLPAGQSSPPFVSAPLEIQMPGPATRGVFDGPNLHGEDAPPVLPPALARGAGLSGSAVIPASATKPATTPAVELQQPPSVESMVDEWVTAASAEEPVGIQLVNPAAALVDPAAQGLQQAIYFEASDR